MPYIDPDKRARLDFDAMRGRIRPNDVGELNFVLTSICCNYLHDEGKTYEVLNEIIGVLECVKQEFYRRVVVPYEANKKELNGDVY